MAEKKTQEELDAETQAKAEAEAQEAATAANLDLTPRPSNAVLNEPLVAERPEEQVIAPGGFASDPATAAQAPEVKLLADGSTKVEGPDCEVCGAILRDAEYKRRHVEAFHPPIPPSLQAEIDARAADEQLVRQALAGLRR